MSANYMLLPILIPFIAGVLCLACYDKLAKAAGPVLVLATLANLVSAILLFKQDLAGEMPFGGFGLTLSLRNDAFSSFILLSAAVLGLLLAVYAASFMRGKKMEGVFFAFYLFTISLLQGAVLADHLITLLFFWEGMLITLFAMIAVGHAGAFRTAVKAFFINGVTDLCMMAGIALVLAEAKTLSISAISKSPLSTDGLAGLAFVLLFIGAISKAGSMPFHSWIPDAAGDAPLPFMALMPGAMEKLLGIYFLSRISLDMFKIGDSWASTLLMTVGAVTLLLAVLMALVQKDFKRLLSFHAISQVGYMILGIGTGTALGVIGGLFHMLNNAMYKSTLFLTGGAVERQAGTTDLRRIGGLGTKMPITFACFVVAALSISGVPPFNGFYSKELVYDGALERHWIFYAVAAAGSFFTAASFLKLGHAAFKGEYKAPTSDVKEAPWPMLAPMLIIAALCVFFGLGNALPIDGLIVPAVGKHFADAEHVGGLVPHKWGLVVATIVVLSLAVYNHRWGVKRTGTGLGAVDHIHNAPVAHQLYDAAEKRRFDPYELALWFVNAVAELAFMADRAIDAIYDKVATSCARVSSLKLSKLHDGSHATYLAWSVAGAAIVIFYLVGGF
jgi:formate hydrogenlyase subunit 3/multisubunit Na+/H+ antiporter MnhD subunit